MDPNTFQLDLEIQPVFTSTTFPPCAKTEAVLENNKSKEGALILSIAILGILSLYWGALSRTEENVSTLGVLVVDFDGKLEPFISTTPIIGSAVVAAAQKVLEKRPPRPSFKAKSPLDFNNDPLKVREAVYDFQAWATVIINSNATVLLQDAVQTGYATYDPYGAAQMIILTARDSTTVNGYITPALVALDKHVTASFSKSWTTLVLQNDSISRGTLHQVPQALLQRLASLITPAVTVRLIYPIVVAFFSFSFFLPIHMKYLSPVATASAYFILSLCYSLISLAFRVPFSRRGASHTEPAINPDAYSHATFFVYWMLNFNVAMVVGQPWIAIWLIFWIISNVSTAFYSIDLAPGFYHWGYA
ncbi:hypothetical protein BKA65DRAFT_531049 [Rhexocercosporidium sp. MPI-PUGE-AT-0058]|nr:hypothetical protein BKA65DRAFT_531049 [Rhexocercosporidium sp. MPI-PUGE-AT-0058]